MIVGILGKGGIEFGPLAGRARGLFGQFQGGPGLAERRIVALVGRGAIEGNARCLDVARGNQRAGQPGNGLKVARFVSQHLFIDGACRTMIAGFQRFGCLLESLLDGRGAGFGPAAKPGQLLDEGLDLALG